MIRLLMLISLAILLCFTLGCQQDSQIANEEANTALLEFDRAWARTTTAEGFMPFLDEDAIYIAYQRWRVMIGKKEWGPWLHAAFSRSEFVVDWEAARVEIRPSGDIGYTTGDWRATWKEPDGKPMEFLGSYLAVWELQDNGEWKVIAYSEDAGNTLFKFREAPSE